MGPLRLFGEAFVTLFVIMDPPGTVPIFVGLTGGMSARTRNRAAWQAVAVAFGVIVVFAVAGEQILRYLNIELAALQGAGGLLLLLVALELLTDRQDEPSSQATSNVALVPLGTPLLAGPGAIVATILFVRAARGPLDYLAIGAAILTIHLVIYGFMRFSSLIVRVLRPGGIEVVTRIAGLLLAAIAVQLVADSVDSFIDLYTKPDTAD
ncbi:MAG TPA: MarC family protein [Micromonosporaceae bacterium]|nr:MarC family protein [Micromonosporaceae bacterium]